MFHARPTAPHFPMWSQPGFWVLARSDRPNSMKFFADALQSDVIDIQQGTSSKEVHLGAMAGAVDLIQRVSTGIEVKNNVLHLNPELPQELERLDSAFVIGDTHWV